MRHIEIDIESMGTTPGSAILEIGAVEFFPEAPAGQGIGRTFSARISLQSCLIQHLTIDDDTVAWWRTQAPEAIESLCRGESIPLHEALDSFTQWIGPDASKTQIWCKGGSFDFPLLAAAYRACGQQVPWKFWNENCHRTLLKLCKTLHGYTPPPHTGTAHNAQDDAIYQASIALECLALLSPQEAGSK
jgi:hypothetical protein